MVAWPTVDGSRCVKHVITAPYRMGAVTRPQPRLHPRHQRTGILPGASVGAHGSAVGAGPSHVIAGQTPRVLFHATLADAETAGTLPPEVDPLVATRAGAGAPPDSSAPRLDRDLGSGNGVLAQVGGSAGYGHHLCAMSAIGTVRANGLYRLSVGVLQSHAGFSAPHPRTGLPRAPGHWTPPPGLSRRRHLSFAVGAS
jgi:hypothetical protein